MQDMVEDTLDMQEDSLDDKIKRYNKSYVEYKKF